MLITVLLIDERMKLQTYIRSLVFVSFFTRRWFLERSQCVRRYSVNIAKIFTKAAGKQYRSLWQRKKGNRRVALLFSASRGWTSGLLLPRAVTLKCLRLCVVQVRSARRKNNYVARSLLSQFRPPPPRCSFIRRKVTLCSVTVVKTQMPTRDAREIEFTYPHGIFTRSIFKLILPCPSLPWHTTSKLFFDYHTRA